MLIELKKGNKIYIKPKNRGKFTKYCHGKVTDECIRKAKASGNSTLVKRATFAQNARRWKHKEGGKVFVNGVSILDSNPNIYKEVKKRLKKHQFGGDIILPNDYSNPNAFGGVFRDIMLGRYRDYKLQQYKKKLKEQQQIVDAQLEQQKSDTISNLLGTAANMGINYLSNKFGNKALDKNGTSSSIQPKLTTNTWKPNTSLSTPSLGTRVQGSIPDFSYMLNPSYKV